MGEKRQGEDEIRSGAGAAAGWQAESADCLASRLAFTGRRIQVRVDRVKLPNGKETELEMIRHPGAAAMVPLLASGEVLLVRQYRYATGGWLLEVPAGTLNAGEAPAECAARELVEETGHQAGELVPLGWIWTTPGFTDEKIWLYLATSLTAARQALEDDELLTLVRLPLARAVAMAESGEIVDGKSVVAILRAARAASELGVR
jgi:ADP-ribose pyrophosphatase